jgi:hypothetical protein
MTKPMKLRYVAALALVGWVLVAERQESPPDLYPWPGGFLTMPTTEFAKPSDCVKAASQRQKTATAGILLKCVEIRPPSHSKWATDASTQ